MKWKSLSYQSLVRQQLCPIIWHFCQVTICLLWQGFQEDNVCEGQNRPAKNRKMSLFFLIGHLTLISSYWCSLFLFCEPCLASPQMYRENEENQRCSKEKLSAILHPFLFFHLVIHNLFWCLESSLPLYVLFPYCSCLQEHSDDVLSCARLFLLLHVLVVCYFFADSSSQSF